MEFSLLLPILVTSVGTFLAFKLRFFFILHPIKTIKELLSALGDRSNRRSLCLALAGTLGVGNIFGVAAGLMIGGAGSLFWLFISSFFSMVIKYSETLLTLDSNCPGKGMRGVIESALGRWGKAFSAVYSALTLLLALFMGSALQAEAVVDVAEQTIAMRPIFTSLILAVLMLPCIIGGAEKIENITEFVIPLTTIIYITMCFCVIFTNLSDLPRVVSVIISEAISPSAILGGGVMVAIKEGFARGVLSNEAGLGTSSLAHSRATARSPRVAGLFGILEVFFDTTLLCGLTGLVILLSVDDPSAYSSPMSLVRAAFSASLGEFSAFLLLLSIFLFAYSTVICWYFYGSRQTHGYVFIKASFILLFLFFLFLPTFAAPSFLLYLTDLIILLMSIITLVSITKKKDRISDLSRENSM